MILRPDRVEAAAMACEDLAERLERCGQASTRILDDAAKALCWVPLSHPLRFPRDQVLEMAWTICRGRAEAESLREFAAELRDWDPAPVLAVHRALAEARRAA